MSKAWSKISMTIHDFGLKEPVYTTQEASELLGCSVQTLNRWHNSGVIKSHVIVYNNRKYRYYDEDLINYIKSSDTYKNLPQIVNSDLIHKHFGKLFVEDFSDAAKRKGYYGSYICTCECGNSVVLAKSELLSGKNSSCGCRYKDLSGQKFGEWYVDKFAGKYVSPKGDTCIQYECTCSCGEKRIVLAQSLLTGRSYSCGCSRPDNAMSKAELCVMMYLESIGLNRNNGYVQYKTFSDLVGLGGGHLSYDFYVKKGDVEYLIECQGGQHYFPVDLWGGKEVFEKQQKHDDMKRQYAINHNIELIEIPYTMFTYDAIQTLLSMKLKL